MKRKIIVKLLIEDESRKLILRKNQQETYTHIIIKILSYIYFWNRDLLIEPHIRSNNFRPDLIEFVKSENKKLMDPEINLWIECKQVKLKKLEDLVRYLNIPIYWFHTVKYLKKALKDSIYKKYPRVKKVNVVGIYTEYLQDIQKLTQNLHSGNTEWSLKLTFYNQNSYPSWSNDQNLSFNNLELDIPKENILAHLQILLQTQLDPINILFVKF